MLIKRISSLPAAVLILLTAISYGFRLHSIHFEVLSFLSFNVLFPSETGYTSSFYVRETRSLQITNLLTYSQNVVART